MNTNTHSTSFPLGFSGEPRRIFIFGGVNFPHPSPESQKDAPKDATNAPPTVDKPVDTAGAAATAQERMGNNQADRQARLQNRESQLSGLKEGQKDTHLSRLEGDFNAAEKEHDAAEAKAVDIRKELAKMGDPQKLDEAGKARHKELQSQLEGLEKDKMKSVRKAFAVILEGLRRLFNGTLFTTEKNDVKGSENGVKKPPEGLASKPAAVTPEQQVQAALAKNHPKSATEAHEDLGAIRENADKKIQENTKSIESLDKRIDGVKKENDALIGKKADVEKELNSLRGDESQKEKVFELQTELDRLTTLIQANQKAIDALDARRDALKKENTELTAKKEAAEKIDEDITKGMEKLLPMIQKLAEMLGLKLQDLNVGYNGQPIIVINNINGNNNTITTTLNAMGAKINPETQTAEISAEQVPQNIERAKDASVGQIREDKDGNYWQKTEKGWVSHNDAAKKINSDSGYRGVTWFDSQMDENTKRIVEKQENTAPSVPSESAPKEGLADLGMDGDAVSPDGTYQRENPESATPESVAEKVEKDLQGWLKDIQERMDRNGYDVVVTLSDDKTSFVLRSRSVTEDPVKNLKTVKGFAEKRGMDPQTNGDGAVLVRIDKFVPAETAKPSELTGYLGPKYGLKKLDTATIAELNLKMFSAQQNIA